MVNNKKLHSTGKDENKENTNADVFSDGLSKSRNLQEFHLERDRKLTRICEDGKHYELAPQRGCFERCERCLDLTEADSFRDEVNGGWYWCTECLFCVQRVIDMLGWYEHGIVPDLLTSPTQKTRRREEKNDLYSVLSKIADKQE